MEGIGGRGETTKKARGRRKRTFVSPSKKQAKKRLKNVQSRRMSG